MSRTIELLVREGTSEYYLIGGLWFLVSFVWMFVCLIRAGRAPQGTTGTITKQEVWNAVKAAVAAVGPLGTGVALLFGYDLIASPTVKHLGRYEVVQLNNLGTHVDCKWPVLAKLVDGDITSPGFMVVPATRTTRKGDPMEISREHTFTVDRLRVRYLPAKL